MRVLTKENGDEIIKQIQQGAVFIYPTDTIYGMGCDATNAAAVERIRQLKKRDTKPFSVIAPSKAWIEGHCELSEKARAWLDKLPGPYTLILPMKGQPVAAEVTTNTLGVRIPKHWMADIVARANVPLVTTSVNVAGEPPLTDPTNADFQVDFIIDEGPKEAAPSTVIDLTEGEKVIR